MIADFAIHDKRDGTPTPISCHVQKYLKDTGKTELEIMDLANLEHQEQRQ